MKFAKYTHKSFDGVKTIRGWVLVNNYGEKEFVYYNGTELCVHPASDWEGELEEVEEKSDIYSWASWQENRIHE